MNPLDVVRRRMAAQGLTAARAKDPAEAVRRLGAVQAQEFAEAKWSLAERIEGEPTDAEIEAAFDRGEIVRTHVLRPTWHFVAPDDLRWMLELSAPRIQRGNAGRYRELELDESDFARSEEAIRQELSDGRPRTRRELGAALAASGVEATGSRLAHIVMHAELEAVVVSGPLRGRQHTYVPFEARVSKAPSPTREQAVRELVRRYFESHGPATPRDFAWWSGLTVADAKAGIEALGDALAREEDERGRSWFGPACSHRPPSATGAHLIPMYDELGVAFKDLRMVYSQPPPEGLMERPVLVDGVTVGSWRRTVERREAALRVTSIAPLSSARRKAVIAAAERFGRFLEMPVRLDWQAAGSASAPG